MRNLVIGLAAVALLGLAASTTLAAAPGHAKKAGANIHLAAYPGPHHYYRGHGPHVYRPPIYRPRVIAPVRVLPRVVAPVYGYPYYGYPTYGYPYYGPTYGYGYYGSGVGISIGF